MRCIDYGAEEKHMMFALFFSYAWSTGGIFGFPWLVNSPSTTRGEGDGYTGYLPFPAMLH